MLGKEYMVERANPTGQPSFTLEISYLQNWWLYHTWQYNVSGI